MNYTYRHNPLWKPSNVPGRHDGMTWRSVNENYGSFLDSQYERTYVQNLPEYGAKDDAQWERRKGIKTTTGAYGSFYKPAHDPYNPTHRYDIDRNLIPPYVPRLDERYMVHTNRAPYNPLQQAVNTVDPLEHRRENPLPPIQRHYDTSHHFSPRHDLDRVTARDVDNIELSILTKDLSTLKIAPQEGGSCHVSSYPDNLHHVYNSDIKELNIKVQNKDGSYTNIVAVPKHQY